MQGSSNFEHTAGVNGELSRPLRQAFPEHNGRLVDQARAGVDGSIDWTPHKKGTARSHKDVAFAVAPREAHHSVEDCLGLVPTINQDIGMGATALHLLPGSSMNDAG